MAALVIGYSMVPAAAQVSAGGAQTTSQARPSQRHSRTPVATQPTANPFQNPIGQGAQPAVSANPNYNSNRTAR